MQGLLLLSTQIIIKQLIAEAYRSQRDVSKKEIICSRKKLVQQYKINRTTEPDSFARIVILQDQA
jgi:hypothetical protein